MKLLLTNDDGIQAEGLHILAKELVKDFEVVIAAPSSERSACGHSITIDRALIIKEVEMNGFQCKAYSIDGTPADCVRVALDKLSKEKFDMVISGINKGVNLGTDVIYSGTVSAAIEAAVYKIPSIAISSEINKDKHNYELAAKTVSEIISKAVHNLLEKDIVLNINVPLVNEEEIKGIKVCKIGSRTYTNTYIEKIDEHGNKSYEILGKVNESDEKEVDVHFFKEGFITLTPLHYDLTNFKILQEVEKWI
jgi:5'-nucleotidase